MAYKKQTWTDYDDSLSEVVNINKGAVVTPERMNKIEAGIEQTELSLTQQLAHSNQEITELETKKVDSTYFETIIGSLSSGGPRGLFYSISALKTKYPAGQLGTFLVFDDSFLDGAHAFIWDGTKWTDLGLYYSNEFDAFATEENEVWEVS